MKEDSNKPKIKFTPLQSEQFVTKFSSKRSEKKKLFHKLVLAQSDMHSAYKTCELFMEKVWQLEIAKPREIAGFQNPLYFPLLQALVISYARPFIDNDGLGVLPKKWSKFDDLKFSEAHKLNLKYRNELVAHNDQHIRKVQIVPQNANYVPMPKGKKMFGHGFAIRTYGIDLQQMQIIYRLSSFQAKRLLDEVIKLFDELYKGMDLPNKQFDLRIDEGI